MFPTGRAMAVVLSITGTQRGGADIRGALERRSCRARDLPVDLALAGARLNCCAIHKPHSPNPRANSPWNLSFIVLERGRRALTARHVGWSGARSGVQFVERLLHPARRDPEPAAQCDNVSLVAPKLRDDRSDPSPSRCSGPAARSANRTRMTPGEGT